MRKKAIISDQRWLKPAWAKYGIFTNQSFPVYFENQDHIIAVKSIEIHSRFDFRGSDKIPLCQPIGHFPVPVRAGYQRFLSKRKGRQKRWKPKSPDQRSQSNPLMIDFDSYKSRQRWSKRTMISSKAHQKTKRQKSKKRWPESRPPLSPWLAWKFFNFFHLSNDHLCGRGEGEVIILIINNNNRYLQKKISF